MSSMPPPPPPPPPPSWGQQPPGFPAYSAGPSANYAGFAARLGAVIVDGIVGAIFSLPAILLLFAGPKSTGTCTVDGESTLCRVPSLGTVLLTLVLGFTLTIVYVVVYCRKVAAGQSWGHKAMGIRIVDANTGASISAGRVFGRQLSRIVSGFICYLGYLWMLWDGRKQTWHDKIVGTVVVRD